MTTKGKAQSYIELRGSISIPDVIHGKSAYEIAVANGFNGTEKEWLLTCGTETDKSLTVPGAAADSKTVGDKIKALENDSLKIKEDINGINEDIKGIKTDSNGIKNDIDDMKNDIADLLYKEITVSSFKNNVNTVEIGSTVDDVTLSWTLNKTPQSITIDDEEQEAKISGSITKTGLSITSNKTFSLCAMDERGAVATKTTGISFLNGIYYGVSAIPETLDSTFVLTLSKTLRSSKLSSFSVNAGAGQYIYYCLPARFGTCAFTVGGFTGGFSLIGTISFTNASGYTEDYYIYRSDNAGLGGTAVSVG